MLCLVAESWLKLLFALLPGEGLKIKTFKI